MKPKQPDGMQQILGAALDGAFAATVDRSQSCEPLLARIAELEAALEEDEHRSNTLRQQVEMSARALRVAASEFSKIRSLRDELIEACKEALADKANIYAGTYDSRMDNDATVIKLRNALAQARAALKGAK